MLKLIKLAKMAGVMHEADHAYSIWSDNPSDKISNKIKRIKKD